MTNNIYAPPQADMSSPIAADAGDSTFYVVSQLKFTVLFMATLGMYEFYWFYRHWLVVRDRDRYVNGANADIWPLARTIFSIFFVHSLFNAVVAHAAVMGRPLKWKHTAHASFLVVMLIATNALNQAPDSTLASAASMLLIFATCYSERSAQGYINQSCGDPEGESNSEFTWHSYLCIGLGCALWVLVAMLFVTPEVFGLEE